MNVHTFLEKIAADRLVKDARRFLTKVTGKPKKEVNKMNASELYTRLLEGSNQPPKDIMEMLRRRIGLRKAERRELETSSRTILEDARAQKRMNTLYSGRHRPRKGEEFVPASGRKYRSLGTDSASDEFIYRGNPLPKMQGDYLDTRNYAFGTRHPGRAANYAMSGEVTRASGRMFKFKRPRYGVAEGDYVSIGDFGPSSTGRLDPKPSKGSPLFKRRRRYDSKNTSLNTGETAAHIKDLQKNQVAEYKVRPSFYKGQAGYAIKEVKK